MILFKEKNLFINFKEKHRMIILYTSFYMEYNSGF